MRAHGAPSLSLARITALFTGAGALFGFVVIHASAAFFVVWHEHREAALVLRNAYAAESFPLLAYHTGIGMLLGLAFGFLSYSEVQRRARQAAREARLQEIILHSQKLESVGQLASGVAHDTNNLLSALNVSLHLAGVKLGEGHGAMMHIQEAQKTAARAAELPRQLLMFARKEPGTPSLVSPSAVVAELGTLLQRALGGFVRLEVSTESTRSVRIDPLHLEQVVMNLAVNARDAMPEGGDLRIRVQDVDVLPGRLEGPDLRPGAYVTVSVEDTGSGIAPDALPRLFEPFFTTKERGKGTGLGLSICWGIATGAGGTIRVATELGQGSTFTLWLPAVDPDLGAAGLGRNGG